MRCGWMYFIVLNINDNINNIVEDKESPEDGLPVCCDFSIAKSFRSSNELLQWVEENTSLKVEKWRFSYGSTLFAILSRENMVSIWKIGENDMKYSKFVLLYKEYNGVGDSMDIDSWDDKSKEFDTEDELKEYVSNKPSYLFRPKAVYRLDNTILELE